MNKFDEVLKARREEVRMQKKQIIKNKKRSKRNENIINVITIILIIVIMILLLMIYAKLNNKDIKNCIDIGYSKQYCEKIS